MKLAAPSAIDSNLADFGFTSKKFTIEASGKAFKIVIDKLYSDKIGSVIRELGTNAFDSHIAAGCPDRPFEVSLPTSVSPVFAVRDYGTSMNHEDIMDIYVSVFTSTKENTNDQVGAWGLGSKSPFAYTDSFTVRAWLDGVERVYIVGYDNDAIPTITHVSSTPSEAERGLEVSFPVDYKDYGSFRDSAMRIYKWFPTQPNLGAAMNVSTPLVESPGWKLFDGKNHSTSKINVRQGCVVYPVPNNSSFNGENLLKTNYNTYIVLDVPIGSVSVTASRESLSMDTDTINFLRARLTEVNTQIGQVVKAQFDAAPTYLEAMKVSSKLAHAVAGWNPKEWARPGMDRTLSLHDGFFRIKTTPDDKIAHVVPAVPNSQYVSGGAWNLKVDDLEKMIVVVDRGQVLPRRKLRINKFDKQSHGSVWVTENPTGQQLARLVRRLGLRKDQVVSITEVPDYVAPSKTNYGGGSGGGSIAGEKKSGIYKCSWMSNGELTKIPNDDMIPEDNFYWLPIDKPTAIISSFCYAMTTSPVNVWKWTPYLEFAGIPLHPLFLLTKNAVKRLKLPEPKRIDGVIQATATEERIQEVASWYQANELCGGIGHALAKMFSPEEYALAQNVAKVPSGNSLYNQLIGYPAGELITAHRASNNVLEMVTQYQKKYPLLFSIQTQEAVEDYINYINNKENSKK